MNTQRSVNPTFVHHKESNTWVWLTPILLSILVVAASNYSFLLFHTIAEFFAITVAILMCVVVWQTFPFTQNHFLMYLGCGYFWVGLLDLMHTLSYTGLNIVSIQGPNTSTQFWVGTRIMESVILLSSVWFLKNTVNRTKVFISYGVSTLVLVFLVMSNIFPQTFIVGQGLTDFKVNAEYVVVAILGITLVLLQKKSSLLDRRVLRLMRLSIFFTVCAELSFTLYEDPYGISNQAGHLFKLFSFWMIFVAIVRTTLKEPFTLMSRQATTYDVIPAATIVADDRNNIRQANTFTYELIGGTAEDIIGKNVHQVFHPIGIEEQHCPVCRSHKAGLSLNMLELELPAKHKWFDYTLSPVYIENELLGSVQVIRDISERKRIEAELYLHRHRLQELVNERTAELGQARDEALRATRVKSQFLASMSHELRTPLNSIIGFSGVLRSGMAGEINDVQRKQLNIVHSSAQHLLGLINDILDLSRIESGKLAIHKTNFPLSQLLFELEVQMSILFQQKNILLDINTGRESILLYTDRVKLYQILVNLMSNALKFTDTGSVRLCVEESDGDLSICVIDSGIGINKDKLQLIFQAFQQLGQDSLHASQGTGLGLAISRSYASMLGGVLTVESEPGQGSCFCLKLNQVIQTVDETLGDSYSEQPITLDNE